jgi:hypothetical protein
MNRIRIGPVATLALFLCAVNAEAQAIPGRTPLHSRNGWSDFWR